MMVGLWNDDAIRELTGDGRRRRETPLVRSSLLEKLAAMDIERMSRCLSQHQTAY
jgi:hypothetical protein